MNERPLIDAANAKILSLPDERQFAADGIVSRTLLHMPPNLPHAVRATEKFSMLLTLLKPIERAPGLSRVKAAVGATS